MFVPNDVNKMLDLLETRGYSAYIVGGCVRDSYLSLRPKDYDICTSATPDQVKQVFKEYDIYDTGIKHGTLTVAGEEDFYEVTTYRIDGEYKDNRHPESVKFVDNIELDLARRDFTINAIAYSPKRGLKDPYNGTEDLKNGIIKCVGNANDRFKEDALRILRAIRFATRYHFDIENKTKEAMFNNMSLLNGVAQERKTSEFLQILHNISKDEFLKYQDIFNQFIPLDQIKDLSERAALIANLKDDYEKMAVLFQGTDYFNILKSLKLSNEMIGNISSLIEAQSEPTKADKVSLKKVMRKIGPDLTRGAINIKLHKHLLNNDEQKAELARKSFALIDEIVKNKEPYMTKDLCINGSDLMEIGYNGPEIGKELDRLTNVIIENPELNTKEDLFQISERDFSNKIEKDSHCHDI